jgi:hypothetical protein
MVSRHRVPNIVKSCLHCNSDKYCVVALTYDNEFGTAPIHSAQLKAGNVGQVVLIYILGRLGVTHKTWHN